MAKGEQWEETLLDLCIEKHFDELTMKQRKKVKKIIRSSPWGMWMVGELRRLRSDPENYKFKEFKE